MTAMRAGCEAAVKALETANLLSGSVDRTSATDMLWTLLSVRNWENLVQACGWDQAQYIKGMKALSRAHLCDKDRLQ